MLFPTITSGASSYFADAFLFLTLSLTIVFPPRRSLSLFVLLNDVIGVFVNDLLIIHLFVRLGNAFA